MKKFLGKMLDCWTGALLEWSRSINRWVERQNVIQNHCTDVRKLHSVEVSGDEITKMRRG